MVTKLPKRSVVFVGGGLTAALISRQLPLGTDILVLERGSDYRGGAAQKIPSQRDELRWGIHNSDQRNVVLASEPEASPFIRLRDMLLGPFVPERLL
jgi:hypothetical protein